MPVIATLPLVTPCPYIAISKVLAGNIFAEDSSSPAFVIFSSVLTILAEAFGEELVHEGLFQLGGGLNDPLLRFDRPLHRRKDVRDLLLLGAWGETNLVDR